MKQISKEGKEEEGGRIEEEDEEEGEGRKGVEDI